MKRNNFKGILRAGAYRPSVRLGLHGHPMRDPHDHTDIDITQDLTDGSNGALGDRPYNAQADNSQMQAPSGTQHVHGDAKPVNAVDSAQAANTPPAKELSLREQLSSAFKGTDNKPTDQQQAQTVQPEPQQAGALTKDSEGKYRNPDGTFASAEQVAAFEASQANTNTQQQQSPVFTGLTPVEQQQLQSLPAELRQYVERTMEGLNTRAQRYSEYDLIEQHILGPRREAFQSEGTTPAVALQQLFALSDFAGQNPGDFVLWFAQQRGLDLDALLDERDAAQANVDPVVAQLQGQVQQLTGTIQTFQQQGQQAAHQANLNAVQEFAQAKDQNNQLVRPYLTDVMDSWATHITAIRAANPTMPNHEVLQKAYDNACWADPIVRGKMQQAANEAARASEAARVAAARNAGSSVAGGPAGNPSTIPNNSNRTLREELESQFNAARAV